MLILEGKSFASGRSRYLDKAPDAPEEKTAKIFVKIDLMGHEILAQVDTGAAYSMLETEIAVALGLLNGDGQSAIVHTRKGSMRGRLERVSLTLIADDGDPLDIEATFLVCPDWPFGTFLGYTGLLDRIRMALDPPANLFYFGATA